MQRTRLCVPLIVVAALCVHPQTSVIAQSVFARWSTSPVLVFVNPQNSMVSSSVAESAVLSAMDAWSRVRGSGFEYVYGGRVADASTALDNRNVIIFRTAADGSIGASTYTWLSGAEVVDSDTVMRVSPGAGVHGDSQCPGASSLTNLAIRELGYALGLDESSVVDPSSTGCAVGRRGVDPSEAAAVVALDSNSPSERASIGVTLLPAFAGDLTVAAQDVNTVASTPDSSAPTPSQTDAVATQSGSPATPATTGGDAATSARDSSSQHPSTGPHTSSASATARVVPPDTLPVRAPGKSTTTSDRSITADPPPAKNAAGSDDRPPNLNIVARGTATDSPSTPVAHSAPITAPAEAPTAAALMIDAAAVPMASLAHTASTMMPLSLPLSARTSIQVRAPSPQTAPAPVVRGTSAQPLRASTTARTAPVTVSPAARSTLHATAPLSVTGVNATHRRASTASTHVRTSRKVFKATATRSHHRTKRRHASAVSIRHRRARTH